MKSVSVNCRFGSLPVDRAELFVGPGEDQIGVLLQQRVQSVQRAAWPAAEYVNAVALTTYGEPIVAAQLGQIFLELSAQTPYQRRPSCLPAGLVR